MQLTRRAAIEFIAAQIAEEAERQGIPLADTEREVLSFSEGPDTPPELLDQVERFDREVDLEAYERKIVGLLKAAYKRTRSTRKEEWAAAIRRLDGVDVYLGVMLWQADIRSPGDVWRLFGTAFGLIGLIVVVLLFVEPAVARYLTPDQQGFYAWLTMLLAASLYTVARWIFGAEAVDRVTDRVFDAITFRRRRDARRKSE